MTIFLKVQQVQGGTGAYETKLEQNLNEGLTGSLDRQKAYKWKAQLQSLLNKKKETRGCAFFWLEKCWLAQ